MACYGCGRPPTDVLEIRIRTDGGFYGPVDVPTCRECHEQERAAVRAESRRTGFKLRIPPAWDKLTARGAYSEVRAAR